MDNSGTYIILLMLDRSAVVTVGRLGTFSFRPGWYVYAGSAAKNLDKRVQRHLEGPEKIRWHIDYLSAAAGFRRVGALVVEDASVTECRLNRLVASAWSLTRPIAGFGGSDCTEHCISHLAYSARPLNIYDMADTLERDLENAKY